MTYTDCLIYFEKKKHWKIKLTVFFLTTTVPSSFLEDGVFWALENSNLLEKLCFGVSAHRPTLLFESDDYRYKKIEIVCFYWELSWPICF